MASARRITAGLTTVSDPVRLLSSESDSNAFEREILRKLRDVSAPKAARGATWAVLSRAEPKRAC